jgi:nucleotide-binding universal stress UspA family protein
MQQPILVGVDASYEAAAAAEFGSRLARTAGTTCQLVHAVHDQWAAAVLAGTPQWMPEFHQNLLRAARARIEHALQGRVTPLLLQELIVRPGRPAEVIADQARTLKAGLIVLGGKRHSTLGRWLGGSTAQNVARTTAVPLVVTAGAPAGVQRVLVALDTSDAAAGTLEEASRLARTFGAKLRALSVIELLPPMPEGIQIDPTPYYDLCRETIDSVVQPLAEKAGAELLIRRGLTLDTIRTEAAEWHADLVVVGSHGKRWTQRLMLGSVTERLLGDLPASLVVVPVSARQPAAKPAPGLVSAIA